MSKCLLPLNKLALNTLHWTSIAQTLLNGPYTHGRIIFLPAWQAFPNLLPLPTGAILQLNAIPPSTCYICVVKFSHLSTQSTQRFVFLQCYTHGTPRHRSSCTHETELSTHMGLSCIQDVVLIACCESLSLHLSPLKHHAIPVPEIMATNRIINATTRLTATIVGIQDPPPDKMEAIQSIHTLLLGEVALLPPPAPSILPTPQEPTPLVNNLLRRQ
jgi:hypothetical protein